MKSRENDKLKQKINELLEELNSIGPIMRGSVTFMGKKNKQPYFSRSIKGKTKVIYLGNKRAEVAREYVGNYKRILEIIDEMTELNVQIIKNMKPS